MDTVALPLLGSHSSVASAIAQLGRQGRSGLIVEQGDNYRVLHAGDLLRARRDGIEKLSEVGEGEPVMLLAPSHIASFGLDPIRPLRSQAQYQEFLTQSKRNYGLVGATRDVAMIVTVSELYAQTLTLTGGFQCDGSPTHYFPLPNVVLGQYCPKYPECSCPSGRRPTIEAAP
jgi:hypothetical protein